MFDKPIANDDQRPAVNDGAASPNRVQPFLLDASHLRGRIVRLPDVLDAIIAAHGYPDPVAKLLGEALCLTTLLAGMLKFDGVFTFQAKSAGILKTLVCDMTNDGTLRGYAGYDADALAAAGGDAPFSAFLNDGYLAFTVDQAESADRYQGIVPLDGSDLTDCVRNYFLQSEQIRTAFVSHVGKNENGKWTGGAMMVQHLPPEGGTALRTDTAQAEDGDQDDWQRTMLLMQTLSYAEMVQVDLPLNTLLYRVFHEEGVRIFSPIGIRKGCRCSVERIRAVLDNLSGDDKMEFVENGVISVTCEFCNTTYEFPVEASDDTTLSPSDS